MYWFKHEHALTRSTQYISLEKFLGWIISPHNCWLVMILLHAHLHIMCYQYFKCHWNPLSSLEELHLWVAHCHITALPLESVCWFKQEHALTRSTQYISLEKILSWIISPYNCRLVMILLHAHLHIMCYHYLKFHWKSPSLLGVVLTTCNGQIDRQTDGWMDGQTGWFLYIFAGSFISSTSKVD